MRAPGAILIRISSSTRFCTRSITAFHLASLGGQVHKSVRATILGDQGSRDIGTPDVDSYDERQMITVLAAA